MIEELRKKPLAFPPYDATKCTGKRAFGANYMLYLSVPDNKGKGKSRWIADEKYGFRYENTKETPHGHRPLFGKPKLPQELIVLNQILVNADEDENERLISNLYNKTLQDFIEKIIETKFGQMHMYPDDKDIVDKLIRKSQRQRLLDSPYLDKMVPQLKKNFKYFQNNEDEAKRDMRARVEHIVDRYRREDNELRRNGLPTQKDKDMAYFRGIADERERATENLNKYHKSRKVAAALLKVARSIKAKNIMRKSIRRIKSGGRNKSRKRKSAEVEFVEQLTIEQQLKKRAKEAARKGEMIDLS